MAIISYQSIAVDVYGLVTHDWNKIACLNECFFQYEGRTLWFYEKVYYSKSISSIGFIKDIWGFWLDDLFLVYKEESWSEDSKKWTTPKTRLFPAPTIFKAIKASWLNIINSIIIAAFKNNLLTHNKSILMM